MAEGLEAKVEFWVPIEKEILDTPAGKLRNEMLEDLKFIYERCGTPEQYYNFTNPEQDEINKRIDKLQNIRNVFLMNPDKLKELYDVICDNTDAAPKKDDKRDFAKFYMSIRDSYLISYGELKGMPGGQIAAIYHPFSDLKNAIRWLAIYLEKGPSKVCDNVEEFSQKAGKQPEQQYG